MRVAKAPRSSGDRFTSTRRAPSSSAACLIWVKLCMAEESMPVTSESRTAGSGCRAVREQGLDLLVEPIGRAEEQIALQAHALDLVAVRGRILSSSGAAIERGTVLGAVEAEFDGVHPARADGERGAADDHADQHAGDEAPLDDQQRDGEQRDIFERGRCAAPSRRATHRSGYSRDRAAVRPARIWGI